MIQAIGLIIGVYAVARLLLEAVEYSTREEATGAGRGFVWFIALAAGFLIGVLALYILAAGDLGSITEYSPSGRPSP